MTKSAKIFSSLVQYGWSNYLAAHMYRVCQEQKYCSFDFGPELNQEILGQKEPIDFLEKFDLIDIPITYFISLEDHLCRPDDVMV